MDIQNMTVTSTFSLDVETVGKLTQLSRETNKGKSEIIRDLIAEKYSRRGQEPEQPVPNLAQ